MLRAAAARSIKDSDRMEAASVLRCNTPAAPVQCQFDELGSISTMPTVLRPLIAMAILPSGVGIM